jgi:hypothetical protein
MHDELREWLKALGLGLVIALIGMVVVTALFKAITAALEAL